MQFSIAMRQPTLNKDQESIFCQTLILNSSVKVIREIFKIKIPGEIDIGRSLEDSFFSAMNRKAIAKRQEKRIQANF